LAAAVGSLALAAPDIKTMLDNKKAAVFMNVEGWVSATAGSYNAPL
jgi:hypothetical protein